MHTKFRDKKLEQKRICRKEPKDTMVKTLQKKFIIVAMTAVSVLLAVLTGGINIADCLLYAQQTNRQLDMLIHTEEQMLKQKRPAFEPERFFDLPADNRQKKGTVFNPPMDTDTAMSLRFFVLRLDRNMQVIHSDLGHISSVSRAESKEYAEQAVQKEALTGYAGNFKYKKAAVKYTDTSETTDETIIVFLNITRQFHSVRMVFTVSVSIAAVCWLFMLFPVIFLSRRAIRPIARNIQKQKQFVTDAGHELKTPLAIIQANVDAMELIHGENKWSRNIKNQSLRLSGLMQNLLTLAKTDEGEHELQLTDFSVSKLSEETLQPFYEPAALRGIKISTKIQPEVFLRANLEYIKRLLSILFDNAVKYTDSGGTINVSVQHTDQAGKGCGPIKKRAGKTRIRNIRQAEIKNKRMSERKLLTEVEIKVENTCKELGIEDPEKLFDRFYRADSARTQKSGGYGIGLSAAYAIVEVHKGKITAEYFHSRTMIFTVRL